MGDDSSGSARRQDEPDGGGRIWQGVKSLFGLVPAPSIREQIEDVLDDEEEQSRGDAASEQDEELNRVERQMLRNMLHFGELSADDVAVPRSAIIAVPETVSFAALVEAFVDAGHSRMPVYRETLDHVVGMVHVKDVFSLLAAGTPVGEDYMAALLRQPRYVPQAMRALELLADMRASRTHLAIVVDEYSGTDGLVTIEDLVEEIVGEIEDEHDDEPEPWIVLREDGVWDVDARTELDDLAEQLDGRLSRVDGDVDTVGGLAVMLAERVPEAGVILLHPESGWRIEVIEADERRVTKLRLHAPDSGDAARDD